jgi:hypothetical protein
MPRNKSLPGLSKTPSGRKTPRNAEKPLSYHAMRPSWRVSQVELVDPFGWHVLQASQLRYIQEKLANFETMTWSQILVQDRQRNHSVAVHKLCKAARDRLTQLQQDDVDELVSLRLSGRERIWGILEEGVLRLLWWDPDHNVCPAVKKHT